MSKRRLVWLVVIFNSLALLACLPWFVSPTGGDGARDAAYVVSPLFGPPFDLLRVVREVFETTGLSTSWFRAGTFAVIPAACVVYYSALFVVFLPLAWPRPRRFARLPAVRRLWRVGLVLAIVAHAGLVIDFWISVVSRF